MTKFFTASDGARIAFKLSGQGPALLCLAGLTRNSTDFQYVLPFLEGVTVIRMDYRGRGESDWTGAGTYTIQREAADAIELLDHLGLPKTAILGTSRGGLIAMGLAATVPERITGLFLNDIGPNIDHQGLSFIQNYIGQQPPYRTYEEAAAARPELYPGFEGVSWARWDQEVRLHYTESENGLTLNYDPGLAESFARAINAPEVDLWSMFNRLGTIPLGFLRGENSDLLTPSTFARMRDTHPDAVAAVVPGRGHVPFLDEPESVAAITEFLRAIA